MRIAALLILFISFFFTSCKTEQRVIQNYVEDMRDTAMKINQYATEPVIQKNDLLSIRIYSASLDPKVDELYNLQMSSGSGQNEQLQGYLVDQRGEIEMPRIGILKAEGATKSGLAKQIQQKLQQELKNPSVIIRFMNFRIIIMGEVSSPGVQTVPVENLTILEALAMAGDVTEFGKKKEVKVLREQGGQRQVGIVDVTSSKMFESPYYQLQQNDVVLVEATRYKVRNTEQQRISQRIGFALTIITSVALLYNIFRN